MFVGESLPIVIQCQSDPAINLNNADAIVIRLMNNKQHFIDFYLSDGVITIDPDDPSIARASLEREDSMSLKVGELEIEMLLAMPDADFPQGLFRVAQFTLPVERSFTFDIE